MREATGELGRKLTYHTNHCLESEDRTPKGRELWYIVTQYFATGNNCEAMFSIADLGAVVLKTPRDATTAQLESWLQSWYTVIDGLFSVPDYETRLYPFHLQIKDCKILSEDIHHYEKG